MYEFDLNKSLEQLGSSRTGEYELASHVVQESNRLKNVALKELSLSDLRLLIGQGIGLNFLVPLALEKLSTDPLCEGTYFHGDLLGNILDVPAEFWLQNPALNNQLVEIALNVKTIYQRLTDELMPRLVKLSFTIEK